jgi:mRNA-degrading endonuclease RelE of RelBE toxin-antitoxin system
MTIEELPEFRADLKTLLKKYRTLEQDLQVLKKVITVAPDARPPFSFHISDLGLQNCVIKVKKIACRSLKGRGVQSGLRLIYAWFEEERRVVLIELYHKSDRENEDRDRILRNFS